MEYLMTYGWAILVVLIALGALFYLGVFSPSVPNVCQFNAPFTCIGGDVKGDESEGIIEFKVGVGGSATTTELTTINIDGQDMELVIVAAIVTDQCKTDPIDRWDNLEDSQVTVNCFTDKEAGETFSGTVAFDYTTTAGIDHTTDGSFSGTVEA